jgi:hypothetical protein
MLVIVVVLVLVLEISSQRFRAFLTLALTLTTMGPPRINESRTTTIPETRAQPFRHGVDVGKPEPN